MKHAIALALVALALVAALAASWFLFDEAPAPETTPAAAGAAAATATPSVALAVPAAVQEGDAATVASAERAEARAADAAPDPEHTRWVRGRVELGAACAAGDALEVLALRREVGYAELLRLETRDEGDGEGSGPRRALLARADVAEDGTFELPFPDDLDEGWVHVRGRHLYTLRPVRVEPGSPETLVLEPQSGAWLQGRVVGPDGEEGVADAQVRLRTNVTGFDPSARSDGHIGVGLHCDADGRFEVRGLPAQSYDAFVSDEHLAAARESLREVGACETRELVVRLERGGRVLGRVLDGGGEPVAGATVQASLAGRWFGFDDDEVRKTETNATGDFDLAGVPAGRVNVRARAPGFLESKKRELQVPAEGVLDGISIELGDGKRISGRLTWADGRPAAGVDVEVEFDVAHMAGPGAFNALRGAKGEGQSGEDGRFTVAGLGGGPFTVTASAAVDLDGSPAAAAAEHADEEDDSDATTAVRHRARRDGVQPGTEDLALVLYPPLGIHGRVVDGDGAPVRAFEVEARRVVDGSMGEVSRTSERERFESDAGSFFLEGLIEGHWKLSVEDEEWTTLEPVEIDLPADTERDPLVVVVVRTARVRGVVLSPEGQPVRDAQVEVDTGAPVWQAALSGVEARSARSAEDGTFELAGLLPEPVGLVASAEGYARSVPVSVELAPGGTYEDVALVLTVGGAITGEVYGKDGRPGAGRMITLNHMKNFDTRLATADASGRFEIEHLEPGTWQVVAMDRSADWSGGEEGFDIAEMMGSMEFSQADVRDGETTHVVLGAPPEDPVRVHGRVTLAGEPFAGAMITYFPEGSRLYERMTPATVDPEGRYEVTLDGPGHYVVSVAKLPGAAGQQNTIEFAADVPTGPEYRQDFQVPLGRISGRVLGPGGEPAAGARVTLTRAGGARSDSLLGGNYSELPTDADGAYSIVGLRPGSYRISAGGAQFLNPGSAKYGRVTRDGVKVDEDEWLQGVDFRLPAPGSLEVRALGVDGQPAGGADVFVRDAAGSVIEPFSFTTTDSSGRAKVSGLSPGDYTVTARAGTLASVESDPVRIAEGETSSIELRLEEGAILWIVLQGGDGVPVSASVRVIDEQGRDVAGMLGMQDIQKLYLEGEFSPTEHRLGPLAPGKYIVEAKGGGLDAKKPVTIHGGGERKLILHLKGD